MYYAGWNREKLFDSSYASVGSRLTLARTTVEEEDKIIFASLHR